MSKALPVTIRALALTAATILVSVALYLPRTSGADNWGSWGGGSSASELSENGLPLVAADFVQAKFGAYPELEEAAIAYLLAAQDEALAAYKTMHWDQARSERTQAGMLCLAVRARRLGVEFGGRELQLMREALEQSRALRKGAAIAEAALPGKKLVVRTHESDTCQAVGVAPAATLSTDRGPGYARRG